MYGRPSGGRTAAAALTLAALGVVFGDIGTSPLYALTSVFEVHGVKPDHAGVYGMISLVVWTIVLVVSVKYVAFVMRADNQGEGGIMALVALVRGLPVKDRRAKAILVAIGILGVALFFGDGTVTPAISVISSVEGLKVAVPGVSSLVVPITVALLTLLFAYQRFGTHAIGRLFGPIMAVWFALLAVTGLAKVAQSPGILKALSPTYGISFFADHPAVGFLSLGAVVLVVTGAEALYADLGQFDRPSIRRGLVLRRVPGSAHQLPGAGRADPRRPQGGRDPVLRADAEVGAGADGGGGRAGHHDRLPGGDHRRVLRHPPGSPDWASCPACRSVTSPGRRGRSTFPPPTGCCTSP